MNITHFSVDDLHKRLGFAEKLEFPESSRGKPLTKWKMEIDDSPIFRYLYRNFKPNRHLEFGTWKGWGTLYCLEECEATVWTINLPFGETTSEGKSAYGYGRYELEEIQSWEKKLGIVCKRRYRTDHLGFIGKIYRVFARKMEIPQHHHFHRSDSVGFIGRIYLEGHLGNRVCQIYCDSTKWDTSHYPEGFFDSCLIDGGHTADIVISDTKKALPLLRAGGLIIWHDFCPLPEVRTNCASVKDVVSAIEENWDWIYTQMKDVFWITPSWILLGIKK